MKKIIKLLKNSFQSNKKLIYFLILFTLIGIIFGSTFILFLNETDKNIVNEYITGFINDIKENKINIYNNFISLNIPNIISLILIWLLGISVLGIPVILFIYFSKMFVLGFTISSFILKYKFKGVIYSFIYLIPSNLIKITIFIVLINYAFTLSFNLIKTFIKRGNINFKPIMKKYIIILVTSILVIILCDIYETVISPIILKFIIK